MTKLEPRKLLIDDYGRRIRKLRVSLLDACNFRCFYCMPEDAVFSKTEDLLTVEEIESICKTLVDSGLEQIRLTGGEPTMRKDFREIVSRISSLNLKKLGLTTNGFLLGKHLDFLAQTKCKYINLSLDSLQKDRFNKITYRTSFETVMKSILKAKEMGFVVKINTVLMKGVNDDEILDFVNFSAKHDIEVRFLEMMKIGQACNPKNDLFLSADEAKSEIKSRFKLKIENVDLDSTSYNYSCSNGARIGFIASESKPFCNSCSRWRLSAKGMLRACLMKNEGVNLRGVDQSSYDDLLNKLLEMKPITRIEKVNQDMYQIGG